MNFEEKGDPLTVLAVFSIVALFACSFAGPGSLAKSPLQHQSVPAVVIQADALDGLVPPPPPPPRS